MTEISQYKIEEEIQYKVPGVVSGTCSGYQVDGSHQYCPSNQQAQDLV